MKDKLIQKFKEFIALMDDANRLQMIHDTEGVQELLVRGKKLRAEISALEKQIEDKPKFTTCPDCGGDMFSTVLTHYKCRKCKKQFTN